MTVPTPTPTPPAPPAPTDVPSIAEAAAAALAQVEAQQAAEFAVKRTKMIQDARRAVAAVVGPKVDVSSLAAEIIDEGSVLIRQGPVALSVDPQGNVWLVREVDGRWQHPGVSVRSLVDIGRAMRAG